MSRLGPDEAAAAAARAVPIPLDRPPRVVAGPLRGRDPSGTAVERALTSVTLVVFCSTTCDGCRDLARLVAEGVDGMAVIGAMRAPAGGLPDEEVAAFTLDGGTWFIGDEAFAAVGVGAAPFFCVLDASGAVVVEGVALGRAHVEGHVAAARAGRARPDQVRLSPGS